MEHRYHSRTLIKTIGQDLYSTEGPRHLMQAILHAIVGHWNLFEAGWLHCDVSIGNVLTMSPELRVSGQKFPWTKGTLCVGMIIDYDHAIKWDDIHMVTTIQKTVTWPFMSCRLVEHWMQKKPTFHHPLDDLESFLWVSLWTLAHLEPE
ncbi:hypothetical protein BOTBODRAFT_92975, partial [Botryobasidium botryosum FD-172 SS1]